MKKTTFKIVSFLLLAFSISIMNAKVIYPTGYLNETISSSPISIGEKSYVNNKISNYFNFPAVDLKGAVTGMNHYVIANPGIMYGTVTNAVSIIT